MSSSRNPTNASVNGSKVELVGSGWKPGREMKLQDGAGKLAERGKHTQVRLMRVTQKGAGERTKTAGEK